MGKFWRRRFELELLKEDGSGIILSDFNVEFTISWKQTNTPRIATITVHNLSANTVNRLLAHEFAKIRLSAGYYGTGAGYFDGAEVVDASEVGKAHTVSDATQYGTIFSGDIRIVIDGHSGTDSWVKIQALDGFEAYSYARISATLAKGYTEADVYNLLQQKLEKEYGIVRGQTVPFPAHKYPRGKTFNGSITGYLDELAKNCQAHWQFLDGRLEMFNDATIVNQAIVLNAATGLLGSPQRTTGSAIMAASLLNPAIRINGLVHIDRRAIQMQALSDKALLSTDKDDAYRQSTILTKQANGDYSLWGIDEPPASLAGDGVYVVRGITYSGNTHGPEWKMDLICQARGDTREPTTEQKK